VRESFQRKEECLIEALEPNEESGDVPFFSDQADNITSQINKSMPKFTTYWSLLWVGILILNVLLFSMTVWFKWYILLSLILLTLISRLSGGLDIMELSIHDSSSSQQSTKESDSESKKKED